MGSISRYGGDGCGKKAFSKPYVHYEYKRMPFHLKVMPATLQILMQLNLTSLEGTKLFIYIDYIVIYAFPNKHRAKFDKLPKWLRQANLKLQPSKLILHRAVPYWGHVIYLNDVKSFPGKIAAVHEFLVPKIMRNISECLDMRDYIRFIDKFSQIWKPLKAFLRKDAAFRWGLSFR